MKLRGKFVSQAVIKIKNISKTFSARLVLNNINTYFFSGQITGISGENGSGKTTFIKLISGLILPDVGNVYIHGLDVAIDRLEVMSHLGVLLDGTRNLYWRLSAWQNFVYFSGLKGIFGDVLRKEGKQLLKYFGLWDVRNQKVESFSLGMKQKLSICCTLSHNPDVILLDEPTIGLDHESQQLLLELIKIKASESKTILMLSHDLEMLNTVCHRKITINNGTFYESQI